MTFGDPVSGNFDFGTANFSVSAWVKPQLCLLAAIICSSLLKGIFETPPFEVGI